MCTNAAYLSALRSSFNRIIHLIDDCSRDSAALEYALFRVDVLYQAVQRFNVLLSDGDAILDRLNNVRQILEAAIDVDEASDQEGYLTDCQISLSNLTFLLKVDLQCPTLRVCSMSVVVL